MAATSTEKNDMSKKLEAFRARHVQEIKAYKEKQQKENSSKSAQQGTPTLPNLIGKRIRYLRKSYHLTQDEFADLAHVSRNTIIRCEHDGVAPTMENLEKMVLHLCSIIEFTNHETDFNKWKEQFEETEPVEVDPKEYRHMDLEELRKKIHEYFDGYTIYSTNRGRKIFLSKEEQELFLRQIDANFDVISHMQRKTRTHIQYIKRGK